MSKKSGIRPGNILLLSVFFMLLFVFTQSVLAYSYNTNLLNVVNNTGKEYTRQNTQNIYLSPEDQERANKGDMYYNASVHIGANGSRTVTRHLYVRCYDANGNLLDNYEVSGSTYWVAHASYNYDNNDQKIPAGTVYIYYDAYVHIGTWGDLELENMSFSLYDAVKPAYLSVGVTSVNGGYPNPGTYPIGTTIRYCVNFNEALASVSAGTVSTTIGSATYVGKSADRKSVYYDYVITGTSATVSDYNLVKVASVVNLSVADDAGNWSDVQNRYALTDNYGIYMDNKYPSVSAFTTEASADACYLAGEQIRFNVTFHENIWVSGSPAISLSNGGVAVYTKMTNSDTNAAAFIYTVAAGDTNTSALAITAINFNGIVDKVNQSATSDGSYTANRYNSFLSAYRLSVDTIAPTVSFADPSNNYHNNTYQVSFTPADSVSGVNEKYAVWTTSSSNLPPAFPESAGVGANNLVSLPASSGIYYLWVKLVDLAGNISSTKSPYLYYFDFTQPTITFTPTYISGYTALASMVITVGDNVSVATKNYEWRNASNIKVVEGSLTDALLYPSADGIYSLLVTAVDTVGNLFTNTISDLSIDKTGPTVVFNPTGNNTWAKIHTIAITIQDAKTGILNYSYQFTTSVSTPVANWSDTLNTSFDTPNGSSGTYYLHIKAVDHANNISYFTSNGFNTDNVAPSVVISPNSNASNLGLSSYDITVAAEDAISATGDLVAGYAFSTAAAAGGLTYAALNLTDGAALLTLAEFHQITYLYVSVTDTAGNNRISRSEAFTPDISAPTGSITNASAAYLNLPSIDLSFTAADNYIAANDLNMQLTLDGSVGEWEVFTESKTIAFAAVEGNHTISVQFRDVCGNISQVYSTTFTYDVTAPQILIHYDLPTATKNNVTATATTASNADSITGVTSKLFTENGSFTFYARDYAGNESSLAAVVNWIDQTAPTISFTSVEFDNAKHQSATVTITAADNANGIAAVVYRLLQNTVPLGIWQSCDNGAQIEINSVTDGSFTVEAVATDGVGNSLTKVSGIVLIDVTAPTAAAAYSIVTRTAQNVEVHLSFNEAVTITNNGGLPTYLFTDNGTFSFEFVDQAGNTASMSTAVTWIDRNKPQARIAMTDESYHAVSQDQWVNYNLIVSIIPPAQSTIENLTFNNVLIGEAVGVIASPTELNTYLVTTYGVFHFTVHDTDTLLESEGGFTVRIDKSQPQIDPSLEIRTTTAWTNSDVVVTVTALDDLSPVTYTNGSSFTYTENGVHRFLFTDAAGNQNSYEVTVGNIDKAVPEASVVFTVNGEAYDGDFTNQNIKATIAFVSLSPVTVTNNNAGLDYTFTANGEFTYLYQDAAGNAGSKMISVDTIDKKAPTAYLTYSKTSWTNTDVIATLHVSDDWSGAVNDGETYTFTENGTHAFTARDFAGNTLLVNASTSRIDKTAPVLSYSLSPSIKTPFSVYATVTANESVTWLNNGGKPSKQFNSNDSFIFIAKDYAGNQAEITVTVANIDRTPTNVVLEYSTTAPTNQDVYVNIYPQDKLHDLIFIVNNDNARVKKFEENGEFTFTYRNTAGITGEKIANVTNICKTPPVVTVVYSTTDLTTGDVIATLTADKAVTYPFAALNGKYTFSKNDKVQIPVTDLVGNVTNVILEVTWIDRDAPVFSLTNQYQCIGVNTAFDVAAGVSVTDANAIPNGLEIIGSVNTAVNGDYIITYRATDAAGNTGECMRYVTVYDPTKFNVIINGRMPINGEVEISTHQLKLETINQNGTLKLLFAAGKKMSGYFKKDGTVITPEYTFTDQGYYTIYLQDANRNTKLVYVFVK